MAKRHKSRKRHNLMHVFAVFSSTVLVVSLAYFLIMQNHPSLQSPSSSSGDIVETSRAAIIDGIGLSKPSFSFIQGVKETLEKAKMSVDVYEGEDVTIDRLMRIGGYELLILRLHSAVDSKYGFLYFFSAERFNETAYEARFDQYVRITGAVREGVTFDGEHYFALRADLLGCLNDGGLRGSTIILMGCNGTNSDHAINRLFERGVKAIIAWDGFVDPDYTDEVTFELLRAVYDEGLSYKEAVQRISPDPKWKSRLVYLANPNA